METNDRAQYIRKKKRIFDIIQIGNRGDVPSFMFDMFIVTVIFLNILVTFLETFEQLSSLFGVFGIIDAVTIGIFCVEYLLRIWTADLLYPDFGKKMSRLRFLCSFDGIVDLLTILPFFFLSGIIVFRMLRVVRILRLFRINAQYDSFNVIKTVLVEKRNQIMSSVFIIIVLMLASSLGMYSAEHSAQPEAFSNAFSGIWWSVSALLTVGYGDVYPITVIGKIMAILVAFFGVGVVAIPTGIISAGFVEQYTKKQNSSVMLSDISEVGELLISEDSEMLGRTVEEIEEEFELKVLLLLRGELSVVADRQLITETGDILVVKSGNIVKEK